MPKKDQMLPPRPKKDTTTKGSHLLLKEKDEVGLITCWVSAVPRFWHAGLESGQKDPHTSGFLTLSVLANLHSSCVPPEADVFKVLDSQGNNLDKQHREPKKALRGFRINSTSCGPGIYYHNYQAKARFWSFHLKEEKTSPKLLL